jgi:hypothetical protein
MRENDKDDDGRNGETGVTATHKKDERKLKKISLRLVYPIIIWVISTLIAIFYVINNDGFGKGDIQGFSILSSIFSAISLLLYGLFKKLFGRVNILVSVVLVIACSFLQATIFVYAAWFIFGPWLGAFSFPIFSIWLIALLIGNFYILINSQNKFGVKHLLGIMSAGVFLFGLTYLYSSIQNVRTEDQNFDIMCLSWTPSDKTPEINELMKWSLAENEAKDLINLGVKGDFWGERFFRIENSKFISVDNPDLPFEDKRNSIEFEFGNDIDTTRTNTRAKVIIVMNHPQGTDFTFEQPVNETIIVLQNQEKDGFKIYPDKVDLNVKRIKIEKTDFRSFPHWTELSVELKWKNDFSVNGFQWLDR